MANKKNPAKDFFSAMPFWGWDEEEAKDQWKDFKSSVEKLWKQYEDMQKAAKKAWQEQWDTFFTQLMDIQQTVADTLPDEKASLPGMPATSPKEIVEKAKEFQQKANARAVEQADNMFKFQMDQQKQVKEIVTGAVQNVEDNLNDDEEKPVVEEPVVEEPVVEKPAKKAAAKQTKKAAEKPAAKTAEKPAAKQTKKAAEKPAAKTAEKPAAKQAKKPADQPAKKPGRKPAEKPAEKAAEKPAEVKVEAPAEKPAES